MAFHVLALIPARSGSRGLKDKNIRPVAGVPMLVRAIHLAQGSSRARERWRIIVSTDSERYAQLARDAGAEVPFRRPKRLATSRAPLIDAILHALDKATAAGNEPDAVLMLSAATPLTEPADVRKAIALFRRGSGTSVASVTPETAPDSWRFELEDGRLKSNAPGRRVGRRQEAPGRVRLNGAIYVATPAWLRQHGRFVVANQTLALSMPRERSVDVEDALDLTWADFLATTGDRRPHDMRIDSPPGQR